MLFFFPLGVLDEIVNLIESVSEGFPSYFINEVLLHLNIKLSDWKNVFYLRKKTEVSVEGTSVCNGIEILAEHGRYCLPCSYTDGMD